MVICEEYEYWSEESKAVLQELAKCKTQRSDACDVTLVIVTQEHNKDLPFVLLDSCLSNLEYSGIKRLQQKTEPPPQIVPCHECEVEEAIVRMVPAPEDGVIAAWIKEQTGLDCRHLQKYEVSQTP